MKFNSKTNAINYELTQTSFVTDCNPPNDLTDDGGPLFGFAHADEEDDDGRSE